MKILEQPADYQSVADFYAGKSIFITGATGFLGKVILEKLLYSCQDIDKAYVLIRDKKGVTVQQRIQQMFEKPLFSRLKNERPDDFEKIVPIIGDINQCNLGISSADEKNLQDRVSVVFHVAATVKFQEKLDVAINTNVRGTKYVLNLCKNMKNIMAFVHVSTAYSNTDQLVLEEKVYPPPADLGEVLKFLEQPYQDERQIKEFLKGRPNTYTFSKALAETFVAENHGNVPTAIIRPSIVCPSLKEPLAGWVDNWFGATGIATATVKGANRVVFGDANNVLDIIPVDYVSNLIIVAATRCKSSNGVTVYNSCTSSCNPITIQHLLDGLKKAAIETNFHDIYPTVTFTNNEWMLQVLTFFLQTAPAYLADIFLRATGKKPRHVQLQTKVVAGRDVLNYFTSNSWEMKSDRVKELHASLSPSDQHIFPSDPSNIDWDDYTSLYIRGIRQFLIEPLEKLS